MSVLSCVLVNTMSAKVFLGLLLLSGALDACEHPSDLDVTTPPRMEALSGSCLIIPCKFDSTEFDGRRQTSAWWIRDEPYGHSVSAYVVYRSDWTSNKYPMRITGNLRERNCTTEFFDLTTEYTRTYYFRIINSPFKASAVCNPLEIIINDSPPTPTLEVSGDLNNLKEAESVTVTCSAPTPCPRLPPRLTWSLQQDARSQLEENSDGTLTTKIQQIITLSERHDGLKLSCSAVYPVDGGQREKTSVAELTLSVSYAPKDTSASISPSALVSAGSWVNLTCSSRAKPAVSRYTWFRISDDGDVNVFEGDFYRFHVTEGGVYYCVAANHVGNETSNEILLTVGGIDQSSLLGLIVGGILGIIIVICLVIILRRLKSSRPSLSHQTQSLTPREFADGEEIHYGEIDFSALRPKPDSRSQQQTQTQTEVVYSQIHWCRTGNESEQTAPGSLYAEIVCK